MTGFILAAPDFDLAQEAVVDVDHAPPGDRRFVDIEAGEAGAFFRGQVVGIRFIDTELLQAAKHGGGEPAVALLVQGAQGIEQLLVILHFFMHDTGVQRGRDQVMGRRNGMDIAGQVQVEIFHRDDLRIPTAGRAALDAKGWSLRGLTDGGNDLPAQVGAQRLRQANRGGRLAFAQRSGCDSGYVDVLAVGLVLKALEDLELDLGLVGTVELELILADPQLGCDLNNGFQFRGLGDLDIRRDRSKQFDPGRGEGSLFPIRGSGRSSLFRGCFFQCNCLFGCGFCRHGFSFVRISGKLS